MTPCDNRSMGQQVAVTAGASRVRRLDVTLGHVSAMRFPPNLALETHSHPMATVAVVVQGGFTGTYRRGERDCSERTVIVEPAGEAHGNRFGPGETEILTLSLAADRLAPPVEAAGRRFTYDRDPYAELIARRAVSELDRPDDVTPLAIEAAALELIARITRSARPEHRPAWLGEARAVLHDRYAESLTLTDVAATVDVEPERLARGFRRAFGEPMADYLRRIRVDAAASKLASTDLPISQVAGDVGFADQSHLTRWFSRYLGTTPGRYRANRSRDRGSGG
jgi:AraC-like DNA-binding protein/quercetin dioxygenase-like cupin family protein